VNAIADEPRLRPLREAVNHCIAHYSGRTVLHVPNPGNAGDSLLAMGTYHAFERYAVKSEIVGLDASVDGKVVFLGGGGNFVPLYGHTRCAFERFLGRAERLILLPHTIRGNEDLLSRLDSSCTLFCRDIVSYNHVRSTNPKLDAVLAHDMAFHLDIHALLNSSTLVPGWPDILQEKLMEAGLSENTIRSWPSVDFLRLGVIRRAKLTP
jgi:exopolysaccharide biosynthesis predicted pyruvyltransferase EpsI